MAGQRGHRFQNEPGDTCPRSDPFDSSARCGAAVSEWVDAATYRGHLYAVPYVANAGMLFYRKDILAKAQVKPPRTWKKNLARRKVGPLILP